MNLLNGDRARLLLIGAVVVCVAALVGGCSGSDGSDDRALSPEAEAGRTIARSEGCMACHTSDGRRSVGPTWQGLYMSEVELDDDTVVVADDDYLRTAIVDPSAQKVKGFRGTMPDRKLSESDVDAVIDYIRELGDPPEE